MELEVGNVAVKIQAEQLPEAVPEKLCPGPTVKLVQVSLGRAAE